MFTANKEIKLIYVHLFPDERCNMTNSIVRNHQDFRCSLQDYKNHLWFQLLYAKRIFYRWILESLIHSIPLVMLSSLTIMF